MNSNREIIPLFPLGLVLFPTVFLPLHIFEERYKSMVNDCIENKYNFGIVYYNGEKFHDIGCTAEILEIIEKFDDGRMNILTKGHSRFEIETIYDDKPYLEAKVKYFDDTDIDNNDKIDLLCGKGIELLKEIMKEYSNSDFIPDLSIFDSKTISFLISSSSGFSAYEKQKFLEIKSTEKRLEKGIDALEVIIERLKMTKKIEKIIGGNGHLPPPDLKKYLK